MARKPKKQLEIPGIDNELSLACDDYVEAYDDHRKTKKMVDEKKEVLNCAGERVAELMLKIDKTTLYHGGLTIRVKVPSKKAPNVIAKDAL